MTRHGALEQPGERGERKARHPLLTSSESGGLTGREEVDCLGVHGDELDELRERQVLFPPDLLGVEGDEVVGVHDGVDEPVEDDGEVDVAVVEHVEVQPVDEEDGGVVVDLIKEHGELSPGAARGR